MRFSRRVAAIAATLPLLLGTAACGGDQQVTTAIRSAPATTPAEPQKVVPVVHLNRKTFVPAISAGQAELSSWRTSMKMMVNGGVMLETTGAQTTRPAGISLRMTGRELEGKTARIILVKGGVYLSVSGVTPTGKYVRLAPGQEPAIDLALARTDPTKIFTALGASLRSVERTGRQVLDSEKLEVYEVTVDTAKALRAQGQPVPKGIPRTALFTLWLDTAHRPRYISFEYAQVTMMMTMSDFNKPVTIKAPPASKVLRR